MTGHGPITPSGKVTFSSLKLVVLPFCQNLIYFYGNSDESHLMTSDKNFTSSLRLTVLLILFVPLFPSGCTLADPEKRIEIDLNGEWDIAKTTNAKDLPVEFPSTGPVPGLIDMATPTLDAQDTAYENAVYWYKRSIQIDGDEVVRLKINKAKYHTRVYLNGAFVGENLYNFTPGYFDLKPFLNGEDQENELLISVGCQNNLPDTVMGGHDFEKTKYIPGIYDDVELIATGYPYIKSVQTAPNIKEDLVRVVAQIEQNTSGKAVELRYLITETASGKVVANGKIEQNDHNDEKLITLDFEVSLTEVNLWSPESPFLYTLELSTEGDSYNTRFGMRSFTRNPEGTPYLLNGNPYYLRGTNVCILRFFEDPDRLGLPWEDAWVIRLHKKFKEMHWNSVRYCIGFPPERWYEIADSLGILIQDEYPVWTLYDWDKLYPEVTSSQLANEYRAWLTERWNHPGVVIWDAQNESVTEVTGQAAALVRPMDLSSRLWENGWAKPITPEDPMESHPYLFSQYQHGVVPSEKGPLNDLLNEVRIPHNEANDHDPREDGTRYTSPIIINEYAWLWLNRDGSTTTLTDKVYEVAFGSDLSTEERIQIYTRHLGMLTEYWRAHRKCAGVLHFCGLGYSRPEEPRGQTSDHFIDIKNLTYEPEFVKYVKPAFAPVGLMVNFWEKKITGGKTSDIEIYAINDLPTTWSGTLTISLVKSSQSVVSNEHEISIEAYGSQIIQSSLIIPKETGNYQLIAKIELDGELIKSIRDIQVENN